MAEVIYVAGHRALAPQPMNKHALMTGPLEPTNEPYAVAKIAGINASLTTANMG